MDRLFGDSLLLRCICRSQVSLQNINHQLLQGSVELITCSMKDVGQLLGCSSRQYRPLFFNWGKGVFDVKLFVRYCRHQAFAALGAFKSIGYYPFVWDTGIRAFSIEILSRCAYICPTESHIHIAYLAIPLAGLLPSFIIDAEFVQ